MTCTGVEVQFVKEATTSFLLRFLCRLEKKSRSSSSSEQRRVLLTEKSLHVDTEAADRCTHWDLSNPDWSDQWWVRGLCYCWRRAWLCKTAKFVCSGSLAGALNFFLGTQSVQVLSADEPLITRLTTLSSDTSLQLSRKLTCQQKPLSLLLAFHETSSTAVPALSKSITLLSRATMTRVQTENPNNANVHGSVVTNSHRLSWLQPILLPLAKDNN